MPDTHRFTDPTSARTARFSRHRREGISYPLAKEAFQDPHKETVGWENFLGMTIGQAVVWASQNDPKHINPELTTSEPYVMGSHATPARGRAGRKTTPRRSTSGDTTA